MSDQTAKDAKVTTSIKTRQRTKELISNGNSQNDDVQM